MNMLTRDEYAASDFVHWSVLKLFSTCPRLYYEQYIAKTYVPPEQDYFTYGSLVDCVLTTPKELQAKFCRVDRTVNVEDTLKYECKIKDLKVELAEIIPKAEAGNKTAQKGVAKREEEIAELEERLRALGSMKDRTQVTAAMWDNAMETAEAIKRNPSFQQLDFNSFTSQQIISDDTMKRKGTLDYLSFSEPISKLYALYKTGHVEWEEFKSKVGEFSDESRCGWIWDIKTTKAISGFEPTIYSGQLAWYRGLVESTIGIRCKVGIIAGDKDPSVKRAQDYVWSPRVLDEAWERLQYVETVFRSCLKANAWPGAKELRGVEQECFRCSICADRPFSVSTPLFVDGPLKLKSW